MTITRSDLEAAVDFGAAHSAVDAALTHALTSDAALLRFVGRYTSWNGHFGSGVATLAGKIGRCRGVFADPDQPISALADRSVLVGSYIFDAARDEFDDRDTPYRDTHRCLAQALVAGLIDFLGVSDPVAIDAALADPPWLVALQENVAEGYGARTPDDGLSLFGAMGYHLGSEVLADREFSTIDDALRRRHAALVTHLEAFSFDIGGQRHNGYHWLRIHSGHGGGVEHDHFEWAVEGVHKAFGWVPARERPALEAALLDGFRSFARDHANFFGRVSA